MGKINYGSERNIQKYNVVVNRTYNQWTYSNFTCDISLNTTSANLTKKAICTWLAYKKTSDIDIIFKNTNTNLTIIR